MLILIHSSKAMRSAPAAGLPQPQLLARALTLDAYLKSLSAAQLAGMMKLSKPLAAKTQALIAAWSPAAGRQTAAIDSFIGDIYSGMQAPGLSAAERKYADEHLRYKLPGFASKDLYDFWGSRIAETLPASGPIANLAAVEYSDVVTPFVDSARIVTPKFLTLNKKTGQPGFVTVHAKVARGAFANWLITQRVGRVADLPDFAEIGYRFDKKLSSPAQPVFVCKDFGGTGLSIRLIDK